MHKYTAPSKESWGTLRKWFETNCGAPPFTEILKTSENGFVRKYSAGSGISGADSTDRTGKEIKQTKAAKEPQAAKEHTLCDNSAPSAEELRRFHRCVSSAAHKAKHLFFSLYNLSSRDMPQKAGILAELPDFFGDVTSYSDIFDCIAGAEDGLDVFSPAAYFADLMRIIETYITSEFDIPPGRRLRDRRPDLYSLLLTRENTETLLPYTDIIRERLAAALKKLDPDRFGCGSAMGAAGAAGRETAGRETAGRGTRGKETADRETAHMETAGGDDDGRIKAYCAKNVYPPGLPFSEPYHIVAAALKQGVFSPARLLALFRPDLPEDRLTAAALGVSADYLAALLACKSDFYPELDALADGSDVDAGLVMRAAGLSLKELDELLGRGIDTAEEYRLAAPGFYINRGLAACLELSADARRVTGLTRASVPNLIRFARAAALTGLSYNQLDAVIADGDMDPALSRVAAIRNMPKDQEALLPLISSLCDYGPDSAFRAVYGGRLSSGAAYALSDALPAIAEALHYPENDIQALCSYLFGSSESISAKELGALYRNTHMAGLLGTGVGEYIALAELAGVGAAALTGIFSAETLDALLTYEDISGMNAYEADYICTGAETPYAGPGIKDSDIAAFLDGIRAQAGALSADKKSYAVEQELIRFLGMDAALAGCLFHVIPAPPGGFASWQETFYKEEGLAFARKAVRRLARAKLLLDRLPADVFALFAGELFPDDMEGTVVYRDLVTVCRSAKYYRANPLFFMLAADAMAGDDSRAALAGLCGLSEDDIDALLCPAALSAEGMLQFAARLDAVKTVRISVSNLLSYLDALTKENGYGDLLLCARGLPVPEGSGKAYCSALTALTLQTLGSIYRDMDTPEALSAYLLLDVRMDDAVRTSYIREGINAAQTYLNRCRSGLEPGVGRIDGISGEYWSWIMDYSEWKANRMVFVEPEQYLLPDIRSSQSSLFRSALSEASGKPLDAALAESLYAKYLDGYAELSNIIPCASYLAATDGAEELYLFGRTKASGGKLYYCIRKDGIWGEWAEIPVPVPVTEITPIFIFGKLYLFWLEKSLGAAPKISYTPPSPGGGTDEGAAARLLQSTSNVTRFSVKYTYRSLLGSWNTVQTLFDEACVVEDSDADYGKPFKNAYDVNGEGYRRLAAFRITERNFCDASGRYYISQNCEFEKLLIMFGGFVYRIPDEAVENYYPLSSPFETRDKAAFSERHASLCDKINLLSHQNISGRLCSGSVHIFGSTLREENAAADGEFLIFDEYTGGEEAIAPAAAMDESSSIISAVYTADVLKNPLSSPDTITPKFAGQALPRYSYTGESGNYGGEFCDTLNTYALGTKPDAMLRDFQNYLEGVGIAVFTKSDTGGAGSGGVVQISPEALSGNSFYASTSKTGVTPAQFGDLYTILLQCLGSRNLFGSADNRLASDSEIIKTVNLAGGFILKTGGKGGEAFLLTPAPAKSEKGKPAQLKPTDSSIVISYPKITTEDIGRAAGECGKSSEDMFDTLYQHEPPVIDINGYVYTPNATRQNIAGALERLFGKNVPEQTVEGLFHLLSNRRLASNRMFWSQSVDQATSVEIFNALTDHTGSGYAVSPVDTAVSMNLNPKVKLRNTNVIGANTPSEVSRIFSRYVNAPLPVSLRFSGGGGSGFDINAMKFDVTRLTNASLPYIVQSFSTGGVDAFLKPENQQAPVPAIYPIERFSPNVKALNLPLAADSAQPDFDGLYKNYNYELFYHLPVYAAKTLRDFGNYADARKWLEYIYSPLAAESFIDFNTFSPVIPGRENACLSALAGTGLLTAVSAGRQVQYRVKYGFGLADFESSGAREDLLAAGLLPEDINNVAAILLNHTLGGPYGYCWGFFPFRTRTIASLIDDLRGSAELRNYHNNPFDPHAIASLRIGAYEKYTVLEYVDLLTEWGDREFAKLTWDSIANASSLYGMAGEVLGKRPCAVKQRAPKASARCFDDLFAGNRKEQDSGAARLMERLTADLLDERDEACAGSVCTAEDTEFFFPYFKLPASAAALSRWDIVEDRLRKIRGNLDINGNPRSIPLFPAAADPLELSRSRAAGCASPCARRPVIGTNWYRYSVLYACAKEFTAALIQFSSQLLASIEKGDAEALRVLSARQSAKLLAFTKEVRKNTIEALDREKEALQIAKEAAKRRREYYKKLADENISGTEKAAIGQNIAAGVANAAAAALSTVGGAVSLTPEVGSPFAMVYGGRELGSSMMNFSMASMSLASSLSCSAGVTETYAAYARRLEEWKFQAGQAENEIRHMEQQLSANALQRESALSEQRSVDLLDRQTDEQIDFYRTKFSSCNLYGALSGLLRRLVFDSYQTAIGISARAQAAWQEETDDCTDFLTYTYWDDAKCGLMSGEALMSALNAMQAAYIAKNPRRLEITKTISLARDLPSAFAQLQSGNACGFTLPLSLFDDVKKPANCLHKIRSLTVSTQVVIGAFQNINATLTQTGSAILANPADQEALAYMAGFGQSGAAAPSGVTVNRRAGQAIHISNAQNESGMHFYNPSGGAYLPFEGTGAVSQWYLEYGDENPFSPGDINDVILTIAYTALPAGKA